MKGVRVYTVLSLINDIMTRECWTTTDGTPGHIATEINDNVSDLNFNYALSRAPTKNVNGNRLENVWNIFNLASESIHRSLPERERLEGINMTMMPKCLECVLGMAHENADEIDGKFSSFISGHVATSMEGITFACRWQPTDEEAVEDGRCWSVKFATEADDVAYCGDG